MVLRIFEFVDKGGGVVFGGDAAVSLLIGEERVAPQAELAGTLPGLDEGGRREVGPGKVGFAQQVEGVAMGNGDGLPLLGQMAGVDHVDAGR